MHLTGASARLYVSQWWWRPYALSAFVPSTLHTSHEPQIVPLPFDGFSSSAFGYSFSLHHLIVIVHTLVLLFKNNIVRLVRCLRVHEPWSHELLDGSYFQIDKIFRRNYETGTWFHKGATLCSIWLLLLLFLLMFNSNVKPKAKVNSSK